MLQGVSPTVTLPCCTFLSLFAQLEKLERSFDAVKKQLFDQLHDILRAQLFQSTQAKPALLERPQIAAMPRPLLLPPASTNGSLSNGATGSHPSKEDGGAVKATK
jgi:hypothetical protein